MVACQIWTLIMVILLTSEVAGLEVFFTRFTPFLHRAD